jgi:general nucleoside transport system ATP-binding protein
VPTLVRMHEVVKRFDDVVACDGVTLELGTGEIHALLGENGAGKTTLMNVLYGLTRADGGTIEIDGRPVELSGPADAIELGVGMVHQHPLLVGPLTLAENMRLGGVGDGTPAGMAAAIAPVTRLIPFDVDGAVRVDELPLSVRQRLEIVRCLARGVRILVLDEPTAVLTPEEVGQLFGQLRELAAAGCGVVLITHKLSEVGELAQRVTVLRGGRKIGTYDSASTPARELANLMVGRELSEERVERPAVAPGASRLTLRGACCEDPHGARELHDVDLDVRGGEIVCLAGVEGNGQRPLAELCFGLRAPAAGEALLEGAPIPSHREWERRGVRIGRVPEERRQHGLIASAPLWRNLLIGPMAARTGRFVRKRQTVAWARGVLEEYGVNPPDPAALASSLSGGNQQKVVLARELDNDPRAVVAVNPTRGLDIGAQREVYARLDRMREEGVAVLVISTDLDEVMRLADRVGVLYGGRLAGPFARDEVDRERLALLMAGIRDERSDAPAVAS